MLQRKTRGYRLGEDSAEVAVELIKRPFSRNGGEVGFFLFLNPLLFSERGKIMKSPWCRIAVALIALSVLGIATCNLTSAQDYEITDLGTLGGKVSVAFAINNSGEVVGYSLTEGEDYTSRRAFLYSGGNMVDLGTLGGETSFAHGINNQGQIVGESQTSLTSDDYQAFLYTSGTMDYLSTFSGHSVARDINDSGQVVGWEVRTFGRAFLWDNGAVTDLGTLGGETSLAHALNNLGQVVGESTISSYGYGHAFLYDGGAMIDLGTLGGEAPYPGGTSSVAVDINEVGEIAGWAYTPDEVEHAFVYGDGVMNDLGTLGGDVSQAYGINNLAEAVGHSHVPGNYYFRAFLYTEGVMYDLNSLIPAGSEWDYLGAALDINNKGQIVGWGCINGESHAFLMTPMTMEIRAWVDFKPGSCPNPLNTKSKGVLPVAILGTEDFDVIQIDPTSILLEGLPPLRWGWEDVGTPFDPSTDIVDCYDCTDEGPDGWMDLTLKFDTQEIVQALGDVDDGECLVLELTGNLFEDFGGTPIMGEDVVRILMKRGKGKNDNK